MATPNLTTNLPWQSLSSGGNAFAGAGGDPQAALGQLGQNYNNQYQAALGLTGAQYSGLQTGYENLRQSVDQNYQDILGGYSSLYGNVLDRIAGTNSSNIQDINSQYNANQGAMNQSAVSRGLGNSSLQQNLQRANELDRARAITGSQNQFAQLGANYAANIGSQRLGAQQQGAQLGANLGQAQLGSLERVNVGYPDAGMYGNLAQMYGRQAEQQRLQKQQPAGGGIRQAGAFMASGGTVSPASPWGSRNPAGQGVGSMGPSGGNFFGGSSFGGMPATDFSRYGEGYGGTAPLSYDQGYGSMYQDNLPGSDSGGGDFSYANSDYYQPQPDLMANDWQGGY